MVPVVFRKVRGSGVVMALMPTVPATKDGSMALAMSRGQYEAVDVSSVLAASEPATPREFNGPLIFLIREGFSELYVAQQVHWWMVMRRHETMGTVN